ncbi:hypothetical protein [Actinomadura sp. CNU-125]|nr:hypothetical protein [Actinomadura sp. CNU-125]
MMRTADGVRLRVIADAPPGPRAAPAEPDLEDVYLGLLHAPAVFAAGGVR